MCSVYNTFYEKTSSLPQRHNDSGGISFDRRENSINRVAFHEIVFPDDRRGLFELLGEGGERRQIPFHRVREVYRDGQLIWERRKGLPG
jgi:uncharacterized protein (UPF0248 family)